MPMVSVDAIFLGRWRLTAFGGFALKDHAGLHSLGLWGWGNDKQGTQFKVCCVPLLGPNQTHPDLPSLPHLSWGKLPPM